MTFHCTLRLIKSRRNVKKLEKRYPFSESRADMTAGSELSVGV
jgi:hypothetical protein